MNDLRRSVLSAALGGCLALLSAAPAGAWGATGHRVVGRIAQNHLSEKTRRAIAEMLNGQSLAQISTYPDEVRSDPAFDFASPFHFISIDDDEAFATLERNPDGDILDALERFEVRLRHPDTAPEDRVEALAFLVHLVGDLHQPLHVGRRDDLGGNRVGVRWFRQTTTLHSVWDSRMIDQNGLSFSELAQFLDRATLPEIREWQDTSSVEWAEEARTLREIIYTESGDFEDEDDQDLGFEYAYRNFPRVEAQLLRGGIRLAGLLNSIYDN